MTAGKEIFTAWRVVDVHKEVCTKGERSGTVGLYAYFDDIDAEVKTTGDIGIVGSADITESDVGTNLCSHEV